MRPVFFLILLAALASFTVRGGLATNTTISIGNGVAMVRWQGTAGLKFRVERNTGAGSAWQGIDAPTTAFAETNILSGPMALYRVAIWSSAYPTDALAPGIPSSFTVNAASCDKVTLSWTAVTDAGGSASGTSEYLIYRDGAFLKSVPHTAGATVLSTEDINLLEAHTYGYQIAAMDRAGNVSARSTAVSVTTPSCSCRYTISPSFTSTTIGSSGGIGSFSISAAATCPWNATGNSTWIHTTSSGSGNGTVSFTVDANGSASPRSGTIAVAGQTFGVNQEGVACTYNLNPASASYGAGAAGGSFGVTTGAGCSWSATAGQAWIHTTSGGSGNGTVNYTVDANTSASSRSGTITVNGQTFGVSQGGTTTVDGEVPTVTFTAPLVGTVFTGQVSVQARLTDNANLARAEFFIDNVAEWVPIGVSSASGVSSLNSITFDSTLVGNGSHTLMCVAYDLAGNSSYTMLGVSVSNVIADPGNALWLGAISPPLTGEIAGNAVKADAQGNVVVVGTFRISATFGTVTKTSLGGSDVFVAKYGPGGNLLWVRTFGGTSDDAGAGVAVDASGNIFVTGYFFGTADFGGGPIISADGVYGSDIFVAKYSSSGTHLWSKRFGGRFGNNMGAGIAVNSAGDVFVAGKIYAEGDLGNGVFTTRAGSADGFVLKLQGQTGGYLWARDFGSNDSDVVRALAVDSLGDVVVVGYSYASIDFGGGLGINVGGADLFIVKYAGGDGHYLWSRAAGGLGSDTAEGVAVDAQQNVFVTGSFNTALNLSGVSLTASVDAGIYVAKYNSSGVLQWAKSASYETLLGGINARGAAVDSAGNVIITGNVSGPVNFGGGFRTDGDSNIYVAKYRADGRYLWAKRSGNSGRCGGFAVATDNDRNVWTTGFIQGDVSVDNLRTSSPGPSTKSAFLLKVSP